VFAEHDDRRFGEVPGQAAEVGLANEAVGAGPMRSSIVRETVYFSLK
jgi:hypothetical protein